MRLFRRRTDGQHQLHESTSSSSSTTTPPALLVSIEPSGEDATMLPSRSERDTLDDNNYQTVKAVPAIVVINSPPKTHKSRGELPHFRRSWRWDFSSSSSFFQSLLSRCTRLNRKRLFLWKSGRLTMEQTWLEERENLSNRLIRDFYSFTLYFSLLFVFYFFI